jgi:hypothetical protein
MLLLLFIAFLITFYILEKWLRKKYSIPKKKDIFYKHVNRFHKWGEILIIAAFIISGIEFAFNEDPQPFFKYNYPLILTFFWVFRTFMEWKLSQSFFIITKENEDAHTIQSR